MWHVQPRAHHVAVHIARLDAVHRRLHQLARPGTGDQWLPRCAVSRAPLSEKVFTSEEMNNKSHSGGDH